MKKLGNEKIINFMEEGVKQQIRECGCPTCMEKSLSIDKWIKVEDKLPETGIWIWITDGETRWPFFNFNELQIGIKKWMPMDFPEMPLS